MDDEKKICIDCGCEFESTYQTTDLCNDCFNAMVDFMDYVLDDNRE